MLSVAFALVAHAQQATRAPISVLSSTSLTTQFAAQNFPIKTDTWTGTKTLTVTGGAIPKGAGLIVEPTVTTATVLTITPTSATIYRNGSTSALSGTLTYPVGRYQIRFRTPDNGTTIYMDDDRAAQADLPLAGTQTGTHASPTGASPLTPLWDGPMHVIWYGATGTINLPAASTYAGRGLLVYNTGAFMITIDPNGSEVVVRDGTVQTGGVSFTLSSGAGNYVAVISDGTRWITLGYKGTLALGS